jgi:hypothetical protein
MKNRIGSALVLAAALAGGGCQDLFVPNTQSPDRNQALTQPASVELLASSTYPIFFTRVYRGTAGYVPMPMTADEATNSDNTSGARDLSTVPRRSYDNNPVNDDQYALVELFWEQLYQVFSNVGDVLRTIDCPNPDPTQPCQGLQILTGTPPTDNTYRLRIFSKLQQGMAMGYLGLIFDRGYVYDENTPLEVIENPIGQLELQPYPEMIKKSVELLEEAIRLAQTGPDFTIPAAWLYTPTDITKADVVQIAHAYAARFLVVSARTPAERAQVDWQKVLSHASAVTKDVRVQLGASNQSRNNLYVAKAHSTNSNSRWYASNHMIGQADVSGAYQTWLNTPAEQRTRFLITTPDRRLTGSGGPTGNGKYFRYLSTNLVNPVYGTYRESYYQWARYYSVVGNTATSGTFAVIPLDEMKLYRAEAFLRTNQLQQAVDIINATRVANGNLPAVTTAGVAQAADCVPRTKAGACGSLLDALIHERYMELIFVDPIRMWADKRGFGMLTAGTMLHLPIPYEQQRILDMEYYSFGGVGNPGSAQ